MTSLDSVNGPSATSLEFFPRQDHAFTGERVSRPHDAACLQPVKPSHDAIHALLSFLAGNPRVPVGATEEQHEAGV